MIHTKEMDTITRKKIERAARNEITEYHIYSRLASRIKNPTNREVLQHIANDEKKHYALWTKELGYDVKPSLFIMNAYTAIASIFGLSFGLRLMEIGEDLAQRTYGDLSHINPTAADILQDEKHHEKEVLRLIDEKYLRYVSSFVLGLNDALVELTGALAGFTFALRNTQLIATVGLITGIAASLAMSGSEYLSTKEEEGKNAVQAGVVTGIAYFFTVVLLIVPFFLFTNALYALGTTLLVAVLIILVFTFYTAIAKELPFKRRFAEMVIISMGVAIINFGIGSAIKYFFGIEE